MKTPIRVSTTLNVYIDDKEAVRIAFEVINTLYELPTRSYLLDGFIYFNVETLYGSSPKRVRKATEEDMHAMVVLDKLRRVG